MSDKTTSTERQLFILSLLAQKKSGYTIGEIIDSLKRMADIDATRRMVVRDMDYISQNFFVYEEDVGGKTVYKADKYALSEMDFSIAEVLSLYFTREVLESYTTLDIAKNGLKILDKILAKMPELSRSAMENVEKMIKIVPASAASEETDEDILEAVQTAVQESRSLQIVYSSFSTGETQTRKFDPYVLEVREGCWHTIGHCHLRGAVRDLRLSRMEEAKLLTDAFSVPKRFYEEYQKTRFDKLAGAELKEVEVRFAGEAARLVKEFHAHKADKLEEKEEAVIFYKKTAVTPDLKAWILSFGAQAEVLSPSELKEAVQREIVEMAQTYKAVNR
ncbi:MAG: WYL domain-containing protein [Christensenella sp.]|uniref:helix-turn-helix transcriptional regulator n=1 Tax=Christensenella sp. TaxID=1935934 RepID=UPI002B203DB9|nr:WYL domain-containing protein [Christensenella sp.]MEA5004683.1 WYL domain-containing protein [Christensenella sp.]